MTKEEADDFYNQLISTISGKKWPNHDVWEVDWLKCKRKVGWYGAASFFGYTYSKSLSTSLDSQTQKN
jgi:hypothetical protein